MFCKSCGKEIPEGQELCEECAAKSAGPIEVEGNTVESATQENNTSSYETQAQEATVINNNQYNANNNNTNVNQNPNAKSKMAAGLLGIFLGGFGVHNFYLGYTSKAVTQLLISLIGGIFTCGLATSAIAVWGLVEGIMILTGSINTDADGNPLKD